MRVKVLYEPMIRRNRHLIGDDWQGGKLSNNLRHTLKKLCFLKYTNKLLLFLRKIKVEC